MAKSNVGGISKMSFFSISSGDVGTHLFTADQITAIGAPTGSIKSGSLQQTITLLEDSEGLNTFISDYASTTTPTQVTETLINGTDVISTTDGDGEKMLMLYFQNSLDGKKKVTALCCNVSVEGGGAISPNTWVTNELTITGVKPDANVSVSALPTQIDPGGLSYTSGDIAFTTDDIGVIAFITNA